MMRYINNLILQRPKIKLTVIVLTVLVVVALAGSLQFGFTKAFSVVFGSVLLLFLPGFFTTLIFFPKSDTLLHEDQSEDNSRTLDIVERITLSGLLSIIITSVVVFGLFNVSEASKFVPRNLALVVVFLNMIIGAIAFWKQKWLTFVQILPIAAFPFLVFGLNEFGGIALTKRNIILEFLIFVGIIAVVFIIAKRGKKDKS